MNRRIVTTSDIAASSDEQPDGYFDRVLKCIPVEVVAVYVVVASAAEPAFSGTTLQWWLGMLLVLGTLAAPAYAWYALGIRRLAHLGMLTLGFVVVVAATGGYFGTLSWWNGFFPVLGTVVFGVSVALLDFGPTWPRIPGPGGWARTPRTPATAAPIGPPPPRPTAGPTTPPAGPTASHAGGPTSAHAAGPASGYAGGPTGLVADRVGVVDEPTLPAARPVADEESGLLRVWRGSDPQPPIARSR